MLHFFHNSFGCTSVYTFSPPSFRGWTSRVSQLNFDICFLSQYPNKVLPQRGIEPKTHVPKVRILTTAIYSKVLAQHHCTMYNEDTTVISYHFNYYPILVLTYKSCRLFSFISLTPCDCSDKDVNSTLPRPGHWKKVIITLHMLHS